jgi:hypothetical protein
MMRHEYTNASLTVRGGAPIVVDGTSRVGYRAKSAVPNYTVECFCKLSELTRKVWSAVWFAAESLMLGPLLILSKQRRAAFAPAPLARGERKPRQSIRGPIG